MIRASGFPPSSTTEWDRLVTRRRNQVTAFLAWAAEMEEKGTSLRLENRPDIERSRSVVEEFAEPWWGVVVYSCFDSVTGALAVANNFHRPIKEEKAHKYLNSIALPQGSVQNHRTQAGHKGAKTALLSACSMIDDFRRILLHMKGFHDRYVALRALKAPQWGRTTCFDLLIRAGQLAVSGKHYAPETAYLIDSTGPKKGFEALWGVPVTRENVGECEELLREWSERWFSVAEQVGISWVGSPYRSGDFENALCVYQEPGRPGYEVESVATEWTFDESGPESSGFQGPMLLASRGMGLPPKPGLYVVTCGDCLAHVGTSGSLAGRVRTLARLGTHRGSDEVLCAAFCTGKPPQVWWQEFTTAAAARNHESDFKRHYGEPPSPRSKYEECVNGSRLMKALIETAGSNSWEAGFVEAVFKIGEKFNLIFQPRFDHLWRSVGRPPGPWAEEAQTANSP